MTEEEKRLEEAANHQVDWKKWGPYLSERAWGTVREDYSPDGSAWDYFPHDHAHARAYRWNEDGILGFCDRRQYLCFAIALWNGKDPILKERMFGLTNSQGNHGEDVKEYYYFLDGTPTHSYMKGLYKYPQAAYPYEELITENGRRTNRQPEYELIDTGVFAENRYYDVFVEYARADIDDLLIQISVVNRGPDTARLDLLPTLWYRNTWAWGEKTPRPRLSTAPPESQAVRAGCEKVIQSDHPVLGRHWLLCETLDGGKNGGQNEGNPQANFGPELLYTENETNNVRLFGTNCVNATPHVKDGINDYIVHGNQGAINSQAHGTKATARYHLTVQPGETKTVRLRLVSDPTEPDPLDRAFDSVLNARRQETDAFYEVVAPQGATAEVKRVQRQALAGMLWSKQYYHYAVENWLDGDPGFPPPPPQRQHGRNTEWRHLYNTDIFSMPDTWEYPWYAAWDLAFHCITLALVDANFAKRQLILLCREWSMHPNGELPAYEWAFGDVNPPVHAWAALRVYKIERRITGKADRAFLERIFHKLLLNFTWWVNRKDPDGRNVFQGGFLGLDNIGVFDRSAPLPDGERLEQSDGTAWMGLFCLSMFAIAVELARDDIVYEDMATKFFEHFLYIGSALNNLGGEGVGLWDEEDQFFYDVLRMPNDGAIPLKVRSLVGLIPLLAVTTMEQADLDRMPIFKERLAWFLNNRPDLAGLVSHWEVPGQGSRRLLALVRTHRMKALLRRMLDPNEFLSEHGIRSLSKAHEAHPYVLEVNGMTRTVDYEPAESHTGLFGGNSNWRGPIWFPLNYLLIEALQRFDYYYGPEFKVECPTGSGQMLTLWQVSQELSRRLIHLFLREQDGRISVFGTNELFQHDPNWCDYLPFHEYFHGDTGAGLGASHQTGWTGLVAKLIQQSGA